MPRAVQWKYHRRRVRHVASSAAFLPGQLSPALWLDPTSGVTTDGAASFANASSQYLSVADAAWQRPAAFSWQVWFKTSTADKYLIQKYGTTGYSLGQSASGHLNAVIDATSATYAVNLTDGAWHHAVFTYDGSLLKLYVDGTLRATSGAVSITHDTGSLYIGVQSDLTDAFNGQMDSLALWSAALAQSEITSLYAAGAGKTFADLTAAELANLTEWWDLDELSGNRVGSVAGYILVQTNGVSGAAGVVSGAAGDGDPVKQWADQSGNGRHLTQATHSRKPVLKTGIINGRSVIRFDGTDDLMQSAAGALGTVTGLTVFVVGQLRSVASPPKDILGASDGSYSGIQDWFDLRIRDSSGTKWNVTAEDNAAGNVQSYGGAADTNPHVLEFRFEGGAGTVLAVDGVETVQTAWKPAALALSQELDLGAIESAGTPVNHSQLDAGELIVFTRALSASERSQVRRYLGLRYGITVS